MFKRIIRKFTGTSKDGFMLSATTDSSFVKGDNVKITHTGIILTGRSELVIHDNVNLDGYDIDINNGYLEIGEYSQLIKGILLGVRDMWLIKNDAVLAVCVAFFNGGYC